MIKDGANIIDVGGESTRPGSNPVPLDTELNRVIPIIKQLRQELPACIISIDSMKVEVVKEVFADDNLARR